MRIMPVQATGAFKVRGVLGGDGNTKSTSEGAKDVSKGVYGGVGGGGGWLRSCGFCGLDQVMIDSLNAISI